MVVNNSLQLIGQEFIISWPLKGQQVKNHNCSYHQGQLNHQYYINSYSTKVNLVCNYIITVTTTYAELLNHYCYPIQVSRPSLIVFFTVYHDPFACFSNKILSISQTRMITVKFKYSPNLYFPFVLNYKFAQSQCRVYILYESVYSPLLYMQPRP